MNHPTADAALQPMDRTEFWRRFKELSAACADPALHDAWPRYQALAVDFEGLADETRARLLGTSPTWTDEEVALARWLHRACDGLVTLAFRLAGWLEKAGGVADPRTHEAMASTLYFMGETLKWEVTVSTTWVNDLRKTHAVMRLAMAGGMHRKDTRMRVDGVDVECTIESLYFRVLLLARFASGTLNLKQIEILDAWMWLWAPALRGVADPAGSVLRADLDSGDGLKRGVRQGDGPSLYLPREPIEDVYEDLVSEFHAGRMVPATGRTAGLHIEEHVAVLGLIRQGLRHAKEKPAPRADRRACDRAVELLVGLPEILVRGFSTPQAPVDPVPGVDAGDKRRIVRVMNESDTGLGVEGPIATCGSIAVGDLVAMRLAPGEPLVLGKVARSVPSKSAGHVVIGVQRLGRRAQLVSVQREGGPAATPVVFVPGDDSSGRNDACLVSERSYAERGTLQAPLDGHLFTVRIDHARQSGRGWVLAGFEVISSRPAHDFQIA